jgi:hypothetical protein
LFFHRLIIVLEIEVSVIADGSLILRFGMGSRSHHLFFMGSVSLQKTTKEILLRDDDHGYLAP